MCCCREFSSSSPTHDPVHGVQYSVSTYLNLESAIAVSDAAVAERLIESVAESLPAGRAVLRHRLGPMAKNQMMAQLGGPAVRRLARAALLVPRIRHYEQMFGKLSSEEIKSRANQLRGRSRAGDMSREFIAEGFGLCSVAVGECWACGRSTCSSRPASSCTSAAWPNWPPAKARR